MPWAPDAPAAIDQAPYLAYLDRVERDEPTGRARMQHQRSIGLLPSPEPCHTGGGGPRSACPACDGDTATLRP